MKEAFIKNRINLEGRARIDTINAVIADYQAQGMQWPCPYRQFRCCIVIPSVDLGLAWMVWYGVCSTALRRYAIVPPGATGTHQRCATRQRYSGCQGLSSRFASRPW